MKAMLNRDFSTEETALLEVPKGVLGYLQRTEYDDWEFTPDGWMDWAFCVELKDVDVWSYDGETYSYRPATSCFKAGETWFTTEYYESEYQRRLL